MKLIWKESTKYENLQTILSFFMVGISLPMDREADPSTAFDSKSEIPVLGSLGVDHDTVS